MAAVAGCREWVEMMVFGVERNKVRSSDAHAFGHYRRRMGYFSVIHRNLAAISEFAVANPAEFARDRNWHRIAGLLRGYFDNLDIPCILYVDAFLCTLCYMYLLIWHR